jgi:hypothetical protein
MDQSAKPALPRSGATLPEAANGLSRVQHDYGTTRHAIPQPTPGEIALQRELTYLEVSVSTPTKGSRPWIEPEVARPAPACNQMEGTWSVEPGTRGRPCTSTYVGQRGLG